MTRGEVKEDMNCRECRVRVRFRGVGSVIKPIHFRPGPLRTQPSTKNATSLGPRWALVEIVKYQSGCKAMQREDPHRSTVRGASRSSERRLLNPQWHHGDPCTHFDNAHWSEVCRLRLPKQHQGSFSDRSIYFVLHKTGTGTNTGQFNSQLKYQ